MNKIIALLLTTIVLTGCGGGGAGGGAANPGGTASPASVVQGTITGFGSVFIDGERFNTDRARFTKDDDNASQNDLRIGMKVHISGDMDEHRADRVTFDEDVRGPVDSVSADGFVVLGQTVATNPTTRFDDVAPPIQPGDILEVSGFRNQDDAIEATFVEGKRANEVDEFEVLGPIRDVDTTNDRFRIGGLTIDYSTARLDDVTEAQLVDGLVVEAEDDTAAYAPGDFTLVATKIEPKSPLRDADDNAEIEIEGIVSELIDANTFRIGDVVVHFTDATQFEFGTAAQLAVGTKVKANGVLDANDVVQATRIKFQHNAARLDGIVESVDVASGHLHVFGVDVAVTADTRLEDDRDDTDDFAFDDIVAGDFVEVRGIASGTTLVATRLERDDADDTRLRGVATTVDATNRTVTILGVIVVTDANTDYEIGDVDDDSDADDDDGGVDADSRGDDDVDDDDGEDVDAAAFFNALTAGQSTVQAKWDDTVTDPTVAAHELELED